MTKKEIRVLMERIAMFVDDVYDKFDQADIDQAAKILRSNNGMKPVKLVSPNKTPMCSDHWRYVQPTVLVGDGEFGFGFEPDDIRVVEQVNDKIIPYILLCMTSDWKLLFKTLFSLESYVSQKDPLTGIKLERPIDLPEKVALGLGEFIDSLMDAIESTDLCDLAKKMVVSVNEVASTPSDCRLH